mgnify:FL=1|tara:strand:- start:311 stop:514 length:204 start_codon:yes stop_codon:yes gene_type:complete
MIKGCVGFSYISGRLFGDMLLVRGKRTINIPLPYPVYVIMKRLWSSKNILRKIFYKNSTEFRQLEKS